VGGRKVTVLSFVVTVVVASSYLSSFIVPFLIHECLSVSFIRYSNVSFVRGEAEIMGRPSRTNRILKQLTFF
jgi:hypothetical protein